ncbi:MAG: AMIN domain-containing protein [Oscillatoria sp. SIO1A7]|nr:AMIN domain-containing protein [Oscillatoria sp. SIO1A7]
MQKAILAPVFWLTVLASAPLISLTPVGGARSMAAEIRLWEFDPYTNELQITVPEGVRPQYFILKEPGRIVLDIPNSNLGLDPIQENYQGIVRHIRIAQFEIGRARIVMELSPGISVTPEQISLQPLGQGNRWVLRPTIDVSQALPNLENSPESAIAGGIPPWQSSGGNPAIALTVPPPLETSPSEEAIEVALPDLENSDPNNFPVVIPVEVPNPDNRSPEPFVVVPPLDNTSPSPAIGLPQQEQSLPENSNIYKEREVPNPAGNSSGVLDNSGNSNSEDLAADVAVSAGTIAILNYPGTEPLTVKPDSSRQEVMQVQVDLYDRFGNLILPAGSPAIGRFENSRSGIRFVVEAVVLSGRTRSLAAVSEPLNGRRSLSKKRTLGLSTLGAAAGAIVGGITGGPLLGGAAAGAAASFFSSPKSIVLEPGEVLPVRFTEHWRF